MPDITIKNVAETIGVVLPTPQYGYSAEIHMPICKSRAFDGSYSFYDPPNDEDALGTYDYRICEIPRWILTESKKIALNNFLNNPSTCGRGEPFILDLGEAHTGFYPFGLDLNDCDSFLVRLLDRSDDGMLLNPYRRFSDSYSFLLVTEFNESPTFTKQAQGDFIIGACDGLMYPQAGINPKSRRLLITSISQSGSPSVVDGPLLGDSFISDFNMLCNDDRALALLNELTVTTRAAAVDVFAPAGAYMFGADNGSTDTYTCRFLGSTDDERETVLRMTHTGYNQWSIPLRFWMEGLA